MIRSILLAATVATLPLLANGQEPVTPAPTTLEGIAVVVNDEPITYFDVRQRARLLLLGIGQQPTQELIQQATNQAIDQLIDEQLQLQEAGEYDVTIEDADIANAVNEMAGRAGSDLDSFYAELLASGINPVSLESQMRAEISWRRIMAGLYGSRIRVSKNQIDDKFDQMLASFNDTQYELSEIFLFVGPQDDMAQALGAATSIVDQLRQGASFPTAAQRLSSAPTAATGGDMGWVSIKDMDPVALQVLDAMVKPGVTDPIEVENGVYIYALRSKLEPQEDSSLVELRQLVATDNSQATLETALEKIDGCEGIGAIADGNSSLMAVTLGSINESELNPEMQARVAATLSGEASEPYQARAGQTALFVCDRSSGNQDLPTRDQIENRIYSDQLAMISQRALRNLKRDATIIHRGN